MYPLYLVALFTYAILRMPSGQSQWEPLLAHLFMVQSSISPAITFFYNPAFWSLPAEWEFYCVMPLLIWCMKARGIWFCMIVAILARVCFGFWVITPTPENPFFNFAAWSVVNLPGIVSEFLIGTFVYVLINKYPHLKIYRIWAAIFLSILFVLIIYFYPLVWLPDLAPEWGNLVGLIAAVFYGIVLWLSLTMAYKGTGLVHGLCLKIGALSYGIYLFHNASPEIIRHFYPSLTSLQMTFTSLGLTLIIAAILHRMVEAPCRSYGRYLSEKIKGAQIQSK
jgi:peptidoglycan/LPS O-acetylase OafA/YrhL